MTGDMTINPTATCLIMTTEILRSMLYRGSEVMREVAWVIYDEVHYMRDKERGVVWEESIILLPHKVKYVFLSATIPNAKEFVGWISKLHHQPCHVVYTDYRYFCHYCSTFYVESFRELFIYFSCCYRPTPLQHFLFPAAGEGLYLVVDDKSNFKEENFQRAMTVLQGPSAVDELGSKKGNRKKQTNTIQSDLIKIVR